MHKVNSLEEAEALVHEAMKNVIQEMIVIDENGDHHIIYIHGLGIDPETKGFYVDYSTPSDRDYVYPYMIKALQLQIEEIDQEMKQKSIWWKVKQFFKKVTRG